jgi:hypothetical protein
MHTPKIAKEYAFSTLKKMLIKLYEIEKMKKGTE